MPDSPKFSFSTSTITLSDTEPTTDPKPWPEAEDDRVAQPLVGVIMGSVSDWETMRHAVDLLREFMVPFERKIVSAHRTPDRLAEYARTAATRGIQIIIAGAGGAAHLPGMTAAYTTLPVLGVPVESRALRGVDSLLSIVQMPGGVPVGTFAIGEPGAKNAALFAISILALHSPELATKLARFRAQQTARVLEQTLPGELDDDTPNPPPAGGS